MKSAPVVFTMGLAAWCCLFLSAADVQAGTVSGQVVIPASPTGSTPSLANMSVRIEGTTLSTAVDSSTGAFNIADAPAGAVTLLLVEETGKDVFTQASKRTVVSVAGDVTGAAFSLQYHWQQLAGYPAVWQTTGYDTWETYFVSDLVGFILFKISGTPERMELYGTADGGASWAEVGHWEKDDAQYSAGTQFYPSGDMKIFFADATHGVVLASTGCLPCGGCNAGFFRTADGGANWTYVSLPLVGTAYAIAIDRFAKMSDTQWVIAGSIGCNVQGYNSGFHSVIWETSDAGASWAVAHAFAESVGATGLAANSDGDAVCFRTPYGSGPRKVSVRSGATGTWTTSDDAGLVTNSGYGPADVLMLGDVAFVSSNGGTSPNGLYRSEQAGAIGTWSKVGDTAPQYMSAGSLLKIFGLFGGPAQVTYDGGLTWLYQSAGGGLCCHGNDILAFGPTSAVWRDRGVGDPDGVSSIYRYVEPWVANFEVLPGVSIPDGYAQGSETNVPVASLKLISHGPVPLQINSVGVTADGTGNDATHIAAVKLWLDANQDGLAGSGDTLLGQGTYAADDAALVLTTGGGLQLTQFVPTYVLITYDLASDVATGKTFTCTVASAAVEAEETDGHSPVGATAPADQTLAGRTVTGAELVLSDNFEAGLEAWTAGTDDPVPDAGYGWKLSSDLSTSPTQSAYIHEDRGHDGWAGRHSLTLSAPVDLSAEGDYYLTFNEYYALEPSPLLHVQASSDNGASWQTVRTFGDWNWNNSGGVYLQRVYDLQGIAGGSSVLLRFQLDWTSGWYFNATWSIDDVRIYRVPPPGDEPDDEPTDEPTEPPDTQTSTDPSTDPGTGTGSGAPPNVDPPGNDDGTDTSESPEPDEEVGAAPPPLAPLCGFGIAEVGFAALMLFVGGRRRR